MTRLDGVWGTVPLEPPANISGVWGGIVGDIIAKRQHLSISGWLNKYDRRDMFEDMLICVIKLLKMVLRLKQAALINLQSAYVLVPLRDSCRALFQASPRGYGGT